MRRLLVRNGQTETLVYLHAKKFSHGFSHRLLANIYISLKIHSGDGNEMSGVNLVYEKQ